ncbi:acyltransferase [Streptomyces sp. AV19]|uniref:acyltransferase family protein n=1 Tax=Streptomyces sp. AV19 TaxID=2793068 RepID=UPI0018FE81FA|nr:acyltransferase [Streptomyces sp. AV19]MBH1937746.1 acyltransferase [Streptomyces sp. AV19]MDG4536415.1 acyltransferase [Streptomyces sp. AV19]
MSRSHRTARIAPLDGLRGLAVLAVLLFHAGHLGGGFLGVDLFFVLSGFLITGLLLGETARHGRIALAAFWGRRARRLLPALGVVGVATLLLTWAFGSPSVLLFALDDAPWVAAQAVNWHFVAEQIGYWNASGTRVFAHLWSIAVEWQFYLVWPPAVALVGRGRGGHGRVAVLAGAGALVSLALMVVHGGAVDTTRAYEGTDTRAFALLLGALVATVPVRRLLARVPGRASDGLCAALALVIGAAWVLTDGQNAPGLFRGGLFAHSAACALLIGLLAQDPDGRAGRLAGSPVPRRLGELSYSLYLWHWPVYLLLPQTVSGVGGWGRTAVAIGVSLLAAWATKVLVEDPVRFRVRWAAGRRGLLALAAALAVAAGVWAAVPQPHPGAGTVDVGRLTAP